eukprot:gene15858-21491_t
MDLKEMNSELLLCARYDELEDMLQLIQTGAEVNHQDTNSGNSALHFAAANGHVQCIKALHKTGGKLLKNSEGNLPLHWAAQNKQLESLQCIFELYGDEVDVLVKNNLGRSILTEAFQSQNTGVIELCLSHSSATEDKLIIGKESVIEKKEEENHDNSNNDNGKAPTNSKNSDISANNNEIEGAVTHTLKLNVDYIVKIRELPITRADNPFGTEDRPEDDTTGLGVWPAAIILSHWLLHLKNEFKNKVVLELGAGCGLPAITTALHCNPSTVYLTDIHESTLQNAVFNVNLNQRNDKTSQISNKNNDNKNVYLSTIYDYSSNEEIINERTNIARQTNVEVLKVNWQDSSTFPPLPADIILGSDLIYDSSILSIFVPAVNLMLNPGGVLLYVAPDSGRDGMIDLIAALSEVNIICIEQSKPTR